MCLDLSRLPLLNISVYQCPVSCFQNILKSVYFPLFLIKWVGWYKMWELIIYLNAINFLHELKIKRFYCFMFT